MTADLTPRQTQILKCVIEEYINTAEPVGSEELDRKYNLGVSPATIRNEMVILAEKKFLRQPPSFRRPGSHPYRHALLCRPSYAGEATIRGRRSCRQRKGLGFPL